MFSENMLRHVEINQVRTLKLCISTRKIIFLDDSFFNVVVVQYNAYMNEYLESLSTIKN